MESQYREQLYLGPGQAVLVLGLVAFGIALFTLIGPTPPGWVVRAVPALAHARWNQLLGIYLVTMASAHVVIHTIVVLLRQLFQLPFRHSGKEKGAFLWPPVAVGIFEAAMYPTLFLMGRPEGIGV